MHSAFQRACNLLISDGNPPATRIIALLCPEIGNMPHGIIVDAPRGFTFNRHLKSGRIVACEGGRIRFRESSLTIDCSDAKIWERSVSDLQPDLISHGMRERWWAVRDRLLAHGRENDRPVSPFLFLFRGRDALPATCVYRESIICAVPDLISAARRQYAAETLAALSRLIGLGPGLTPSGDDFTVGFLAGLWCGSGQRPGQREYLLSLDQAMHGVPSRALPGTLSRTTDISRAFLSSALKGRFSETLTDLIEQITMGSSLSALEQATVRALDVGSTSGSDGVSGLLLSLSVSNGSACVRNEQTGDLS